MQGAQQALPFVAKSGTGSNVLLHMRSQLKGALCEPVRGCRVWELNHPSPVLVLASCVSKPHKHQPGDCAQSRVRALAAESILAFGSRQQRGSWRRLTRV